MALVTCPTCASDEDIHVDEKLGDGRLRVRCGECGTGWVHGQPAVPAPKAMSSFDKAWLKFPTPAMVSTGRHARVEELKQQFLTMKPVEDPAVAPYWRHYQQVFFRDGLWTCKPQDLKDFANSDVGANPGNMSAFNTAWNQMGEAAAAEQVRSTIDYLLYGPDSILLEDRLTHLIQGTKGMGMTGFRESLLTRVLCIVKPDEFLPILTYSGAGTGKRDITQAVFGLKMPKQDQVSMQIGRLAVWSNNLLLELVGDGFESCQHASAFLWWAKDQHFGGETA